MFRTFMKVVFSDSTAAPFVGKESKYVAAHIDNRCYNIGEWLDVIPSCDVAIYSSDVPNMFNIESLKSINLHESVKRVIINSHWEGGDSVPGDKDGFSKEWIIKKQKEMEFYLKIPVSIITQNESASDADIGIYYLHLCWLHGGWWPLGDIDVTDFKQCDSPFFKFNYIIGEPRECKIKMAASLYKAGLLNDNISAWVCTGKPHNLASSLFQQEIYGGSDIFTERRLSPYKDGRSLTVEEMVNELPNGMIHDGFYNRNINEQKYNINPVYCMYNSMFSLVQETDMTATTNRYTEKTVKAIQSGIPFIIAGNYKCLELLRKDGFMTCESFIDESYDSIENIDERIRAITLEVRRLCSLNTSQWNKINKQMQYISGYNKKLFTDKKMHSKYGEVLRHIIYDC